MPDADDYKKAADLLARQVNEDLASFDLESTQRFYRQDFPGKKVSIDQLSEDQKPIEPLSDTATRIDLNHDGVYEFICVPDSYITKDGQWAVARGASGNGPAWIFTWKDNRWIEIGKLGGLGVSVLPTKTNGWHDLKTRWHMSVARAPATIYKFQNGRYSAVSK